MFTPWNPESNIFTTSGPLLVVFIVSLIRKLLEDWKRHRADNIQNGTLCEVLVSDHGSNPRLEKVEWKDVVLGDIIRVPNHTSIPADLIILTSSEPEGRCFTETSNLDGETNLKRKEAAKALCELVGVRADEESKIEEKEILDKLANLKGTIQVEKPNKNLYSFNGSVTITGNSEVIPVGKDNVVWRGCSLRNCEYIYGVVIYIGPETRIMMNARKAPLKTSLIYQKVNKLIIMIFALMVVVVIVSMIMYFGFIGDASKYWFLNMDDGKADAGSFFTFFILYNNFVPISLYVSLDFIKFFQAMIMENDQSMYDEENDMSMIVRSAEICENLGQIEYIFSDKTGTLTRNVMELKQFFVSDKQIYGIVGEVAHNKENELCTPENSAFNPDPTVSFKDLQYKKDIVKDDEQSEALDIFLKCLSLCHTVVPEKKQDGSIEYRASSPDEIALVKAAKALGYNVEISGKNVTLTINTKDPEGKKEYYTILAVNEFESNRKRMSILLQDKQDDSYWLYCKGADTNMIPLFDTFEQFIPKNLAQMACLGLRTLVCGRKKMNEIEVSKWLDEYNQCKIAIEDRDKKLSDCACKIESHLQWIGCTAIEDRLQDGVPECIHNMILAGIKVWMLTGDKLETAENIGKSCQLLTPDMTCYTITGVSPHGSPMDTPADTPAQTPASTPTHKKGNLTTSGNTEKEDAESIIKQQIDMIPSKPEGPYAVIVTGTALLSIIHTNHKDPNKPVMTPLLQEFIDKTKNASSVIACRVSPSQKASIVNSIRYTLKSHPITLAIGDGANDVNMIQSAHVGIGIMGKEGVQAVNNSDFAIGQFRFLNQLILVYGKDVYRRVCVMILYSFYKNISLVLTLFFFNFYNGQSGTTFYESLMKLTWNFFLALPIIAFGCQDYYVSPQTSIEHPQLYKFGIKNMGLNTSVLLQWIIQSIIHAVIPFFVGVYIIETAWGTNGEMDGLTFYGTGIFTSLFMIMNFKVYTYIYLYIIDDEIMSCMVNYI